MRRVLLVILTLFVSSFVFAQVDKYPLVKLVIGKAEYAVAGDKSTTPIAYRELDVDMVLPTSSIIRTGPDGYVEVLLDPNKTIKIFNSSTISLLTFYSENTVTLDVGKIKAKVGKLVGSDSFKVKTDSGIAAVRGTEFGVIYNVGSGGGISLMEVLVSEGLVALSTPDGRTVEIPAGYSSSISKYPGGVDLETPKPVSPEVFSKYFEEPVQAQQQQEIQPTQEKQQPGITPNQVPQQPSAPPAPSAPSEPKFSFGYQISAENIDNVVWNKIVLSPVFQIGDFGVGLYIVSYWNGKDNVYDTSKWYNGAEYNFGFHENAFDIRDFSDDLFKKILFLSYGQKGKQVFIRLGNIPDMTLGHGFIIDRYSNMLGFPAIRKIGLQFDLDLGVYGFESAFADLSRTRMFGMRHYVRPLYGTPVLGNLAFGVTGAIDLEPYIVQTIVNSNTNTYAYEGNPSVFSVGIDADFPVIDIGIFSMTLFADFAKSGIYINKKEESLHLYLINSNLNEGFNLFDGFGLSGGVKGVVLVLPWRLEYRRTTGSFIASYFDTLYDAQKTEKLISLISSNIPSYNGLLGSIGVKLENIAEGYIEYQQLWPEDGSLNSVNSLSAKFVIDKEIIKSTIGVPAYGSLTFRRNNIPSIQDFFADVLKDGVAKLEVAYSVSPDLDIAISYRRFYISSTEYQDSIGIQLRSSIFGDLGM